MDEIARSKRRQKVGRQSSPKVREKNRCREGIVPEVSRGKKGRKLSRKQIY